jgi:hypothetical protein
MLFVRATVVAFCLLLVASCFDVKPAVFGKVTKKNRLLGSIVQTVRGGISYRFQMRKSEKISKYGRIIRAHCRQKRNSVVSDDQIIDSPIVGQVESETSIILTTAIIS